MDQPKKTVGRKRVAEPKQKTITVKCSLKEKEALKKKAGELTMSSYLLAVGLNYKHVLDKKPKLTLEFKADLRKIGVNLNQIARQLNSKYGLVSMEELYNEIKHLDQKISEIIDKLDQ